MAECGDFWFWFSRPAAEVLGTLAMLLVASVPVMA